MKRFSIHFKNINLKFGQKTIFNNFNLDIRPQDKVVIYGKSGTGKSTLLKLILGFIKPESGQIYFNNQPINSENIHIIRKQIAYVDQDVIIGQGKVMDLIHEYLSFQANQHLHLKRIDIEKLITNFELDIDLLDKDVDQLSGGERQRVAIIIALLLKRPIMVLDEVTASLDTHSKKITIENLLNRKNLTVIVVTHDQEWKKANKVKLFNFKDKKWEQ